MAVEARLASSPIFSAAFYESADDAAEAIAGS